MSQIDRQEFLKISMALSASAAAEVSGLPLQANGQDAGSPLTSMTLLEASQR